MIESKQEFNEVLERLRTLKKENRLGRHMESQLEAFEEVQGLINLPINGVVFNEAENCPKCLKPKRTKPNTIQMLCECNNSEVELREHKWVYVDDDEEGTILYCSKCWESTIKYNG